jgi:rubrerythrin
MAILKGSRTHDNLKAAFANEAQANRRYLYFARQADIEGYPEIAGLFRDTAEGEAGHGYGHLDHLRKVGDPLTGMPMGGTQANLEAAIAGESMEYTKLYPMMAATAREEGFPEIAEWFERLANAERNHAERFTRGLDSVRAMEQELQVR